MESPELTFDLSDISRILFSLLFTQNFCFLKPSLMSPLTLLSVSYFHLYILLFLFIFLPLIFLFSILYPFYISISPPLSIFIHFFHNSTTHFIYIPVICFSSNSYPALWKRNWIKLIIHLEAPNTHLEALENSTVLISQNIY